MSRIKTPLPPIDDLHHLFSCNYETGQLYWKNPRSTRLKIGDPVYYQPKSSGYQRIRIRIDGKDKFLLVHRIIWAMYYREDPGQQELDHIDRDPSNNSIKNLRIATPSENQYNRNVKGYKRDNYYKGRPCSSGGWEARINIDGKQTYLGTFPCPLLARLCFEDKKRQIAKTFCPF